MSNSVFQRAIVVGASSGMGAEIARQLAAKGSAVALVARRETELQALADEINAKSADPIAFPYVHDVVRQNEVPALFQNICRDLGGLDVIFYAAGVMPRITDSEYSFDKDRAMIEVNVLGAIAWLNEAAQRFEAAGSGTIVGLSSVAGDRGRRGQPVYCTSKAALDTYLEALRNRVGRSGVRVVTIKPGPVDTPLTKGLDKLPMLISAGDACAADHRRLRKGTADRVCPRQVAARDGGDQVDPVPDLSEAEHLASQMSLLDDSRKPEPLPFLPRDRAESVSGWGQSWRTVGYVYRPINADGIRDVFVLAREKALHVGLRGGGNSYGDAATAREHLVLDLTRMNRFSIGTRKAGLSPSSRA
jgi:NAD(P)-dependent dehydrogenase (short-subunit alcohol dehydrogenase family)